MVWYSKDLFWIPLFLWLLLFLLLFVSNDFWASGNYVEIYFAKSICWISIFICFVSFPIDSENVYDWTKVNFKKKSYHKLWNFDWKTEVVCVCVHINWQTILSNIFRIYYLFVSECLSWKRFLTRYAVSCNCANARLAKKVAFEIDITIFVSVYFVSFRFVLRVFERKHLCEPPPSNAA